MNTISGQISSINQLSSQVAVDRRPVETVQESTKDNLTAAPAEGVKVSLSGASIQKAADEKNANPDADIESSGLPDQAQKILKMIREIQRKIDEKMQEMQEVMGDTSLDEVTRKARIGTIQSALAGLTASLMSANNELDKLSKNGTLSDAQSKQATQLAMKK